MSFGDSPKSSAEFPRGRIRADGRKIQAGPPQPQITVIVNRFSFWLFQQTTTMFASKAVRNSIQAIGAFSTKAPTVAVLHPAIDPPVINGVTKPRKPGGFRRGHSYTLRQKGVKVIKSDPLAPVSSHVGWAFPDTEEGIYSAAQQCATHFWANTILFTSHPLQTSPELTPVASEIYVVGQPPGLAENFDDKAYLNDKLRELGGYTLPKSWLVSPKNISEIINHIDRYPIVGKPVRRCGSHGVKVCHDKGQLQQHVQTLRESPLIMLEEFLSGEEATITVMPPAIEHPQHWSMLTVTRFKYAEGIAPYNGVVAVTSNSRVISQSELKDPGYRKVMRECESVAALIRATAPVRVYVRQFVEGSDFALFDINMKPNMTGPDRPGHQDQASLTAIAVSAIR
ncbi:hypothetical protein AtubIFM56815_002060 [Aspergillus tubingensis]|uniref:ATP-grasp domain-containing protein n=1 Tax=Aspergillus tubingensis TaxID=5068 RepID=A0A9W6AVW3_ASPTU|nr:hypothetical protein AtubIFM56815_002060 [Aspergillus tubingensis]GLB19504.1 hypothetical protein AtubIFM61612_009411 [Aspergillus tubingensis]